MTKQELMENFTMEELADRIILAETVMDSHEMEYVKYTLLCTIEKLKSKIASLEEENGILQARVNTYVDYILPTATREAKELLDKNNFEKIIIISSDQWNKSVFEIKNLEIELAETKEKLAKAERKVLGSVNKEEYERLISYINKYKCGYKEANDEINRLKEEHKNEIDELKADIAELHCEAQAAKVFPDELPKEPIDVAKMLINAKKEHIEGLRQIARHLLVYCKSDYSPRQAVKVLTDDIMQ